MRTLISFLMCCGLLYSAPVLLSHAVGGALNNATTTPAIDTRGASMIGVCITSTSATATLTDSAGNSWTLQVTDNNNTVGTVLYFVLAPTTSATHTFTANSSGKAPSIEVAAFAGVRALDASTNSGSSATNLTTIQPGSLTPIVKDEMFLTCEGDVSTAGTKSINGSFAITDQKTLSGGNFYGSAMAWMTEINTTAQNPTWTTSGGTGQMSAVMATFTASFVYSGSPINQQAAPLRPVETTTYHDAVGTGDTQFYAWTSATTLAGNWSGGNLIAAYNDGSGFGCGSSSICLYQLQAYTAGTSITVAGLNTMTSYGGSSAASCYDGINQMKSRKPFAFKGVIFLPIVCIQNGTFSGLASGFIVSKDSGATWCNYKTFQAQGNDCTSGKANGDNPVDAAGFQFPIADGTNKMTRMQIVDFLCQDNTINCPVAPGVDSSFLYWMTTLGTGVSGPDYVFRMPKSNTWQQMMALNAAQAYNAGVWDSTLQNATSISGSALGCCSSITWMQDFGVFVIWEHAPGTTTHTFQTSAFPWGPFVTGGTITFPITAGFFGPVPALCPKYSGFNVTCTFENSPSANLNLTDFTLGGKALTYGTFQ